MAAEPLELMILFMLKQRTKHPPMQTANRTQNNPRVALFYAYIFPYSIDDYLCLRHFSCKVFLNFTLLKSPKGFKPFGNYSYN